MDQEPEYNNLYIYCAECGADITSQHINECEEGVLCDACEYIS